MSLLSRLSDLAEDIAATFKAQRHGPYLVVYNGQSNAVGYDTATNGDKTTNSNVFAWNNTTHAWGVATLGVSPFNTATGEPNNFAFHFAKVLQEFTGEIVYLVGRPVGATSITTWLDPTASHGTGTGENWDLFDAEIVLALASTELTSISKSTADVFLWHQGENDELLALNDYKVHVRNLVDQVREQSWGYDELPFIAGEMVENGSQSAMTYAYREIVNESRDPYFGLASAAGLLATGVHFNGSALERLGRERYWAEFQSMPRAYVPVEALTTLEAGIPIIGRTQSPSSLFARTAYDLVQARYFSLTATGAIVFHAPNTTSTIMHQLVLRGSRHTTDYEAYLDCTVYGYRASGAWNTTRVDHRGTWRPKIRWAVDPNGNNCLIVGDVADVLEHPHIVVAMASISHTNASDTYLIGWTADKITATTGYTEITSDLSASALGEWFITRKTADQNVISSTTLVDDTELKFPMRANTKYAFRMVVIFDAGATGDFKFRHTGPAIGSGLIRILRQWIVGAGAAWVAPTQDTSYSAADIAIAGAAGSGRLEINGTIHNGATAGDFKLRWAQNASEAVNTTVRAGSYIEWMII